MDELFRQLPAVIEQAAKSPLGLLALMVIALAGMAFVFFKGASERTRIGIFVLLLAGVATFAVAAMRVAAPGEDAAAEVPAADVVGNWTARVTYDWPGAVHDEQFRFAEHAGALGGTADFLTVPRTIDEAEVAGNTLTFVTRSIVEMDGARGESTRRYVGEVVDEDTIRFVMTTKDDFSEHVPVEFVATRTGP